MAEKKIPLNETLAALGRKVEEGQCISFDVDNWFQWSKEVADLLKGKKEVEDTIEWMGARGHVVITRDGTWAQKLSGMIGIVSVEHRDQKQEIVLLQQEILKRTETIHLAEAMAKAIGSYKPHGAALLLEDCHGVPGECEDEDCPEKGICRAWAAFRAKNLETPPLSEDESAIGVSGDVLRQIQDTFGKAVAQALDEEIVRRGIRIVDDDGKPLSEKEDKCDSSSS